jgi:hypothetical protein
MTIGDLLHPEERMASAEQAAILASHAGRWYGAHLLLFLGMMLFVPGLLALSGLTAVRRPALGYVARILVLIGMAAIASVFVCEMLVGRYVLDGADTASAADLLESMLSGPMIGVVGAAMLAFFIGTAMFALPLIHSRGALGPSAALLLTGATLILAEIVSARVILSQIGNALVLCGSASAARVILRDVPGGIAADSRAALPPDLTGSSS